MRFLNHRFADHRSVLKHILQVDQITVMFLLCKIIHIMEMDDSFFMCTYNLFRQKDTASQILTYFSCHIISLCRIDDRILIRIFLLHFFIHVFQKRQNSIICSIGLTSQFSLITIAHVLLRHLIPTHLHNSGLYHILYIFHMNSMCHLFCLLSNGICDRQNLMLIHLMNRCNLLISLLNRIHNLSLIK